jgi:hypothetical protein
LIFKPADLSQVLFKKLNWIEIMQRIKIYYIMGLLSFSIGELILSLVEGDFKFLIYILVSTICTYFFIRAAKAAFKKIKFRFRIRIIDSEDGVSDTIGFISIFALSMASVASILALGLPEILVSHELLKMQSVEQAFTLLDSRISLTALGESPAQVVELDTFDGSIAILDDPTVSALEIILRQNGVDYTIYNSTFGTLRYELKGDEVAYEGGGVWRKYGEVMISPPEFHYNGETLTFPIIKLNGSTAIAGGTATLRATPQAIAVFFQNTTANLRFQNPVYSSTTIVKVKSKYYKAWAKYMQERTEFQGVVTHDNLSEAVAYLNSRPNQSMNFSIPLDIVGLNTSNSTPVSSFTFEFQNVTSNFELELIGSNSQGKNLTITMQKKSGEGKEGIAVSISYRELSNEIESWEAVKWIAIQNEAADINLLNTSINLSYTSNDNSWSWVSEEAPYNKSYSKGEQITLPLAIQHYFRLLGPTFTFNYGSKHQGFNETSGKVYLQYDTMPPVITFLHIVEHQVNLDII